MTPEEKAKELINNFREILDSDFPRKKDDAQYNFLAQCNAIVCVNKIIETIQGKTSNEEWKFWNEVKLELLKL
jgi:hypothetical protein